MIQLDRMKLLVVIVMCYVSGRGVLSQVPSLGQCPNVSVMANFDPSKYVGKWYEAERYFAVFQLGGRCVTADYTSKDNGAIGVFNRQLSSLTGIVSTIEGEASLVSRSDEAKLSVRFPSLPFNIAAPYWVVDTDYDKYAVVWGCNDFGIFHTTNAWILTRERKPDVNVLEKAYKALDVNGISRAYFIRTDQKNCPDDKNTL